MIDIRSNKTTPLTVSDDQEDELLSITPIKGGTKAIVGSGLGILTIWNRKMGWSDCKGFAILQSAVSNCSGVDRIPGHPQSVDAIVALTPDIVATGSEDGMIRVMQIQPHKFRASPLADLHARLLNRASRRHRNTRGISDRADGA